MSALPDEDQAPLEPPETFVPLSPDIVADGREVVAMPCTNPRLSPTLDVMGFPLVEGSTYAGWYIRITDAFGTNLFSLMIKAVGRDG